MRGYLRTRGPDTWQLVCEAGVTPAGKRRQAFKTSHGSKRAAQRELANLVASVHSRTFLHADKTNVAAFLLRWLETYARARVTGLTFEKYSEIVHNHLIPALGKVALSRLQPEQIQQLYTQWTSTGRLDSKSGGLAPSTIAKHHAVLREALQTAVKWRVIPYNPAEHVDLPRRQPQGFHRAPRLGGAAHPITVVDPRDDRPTCGVARARRSYSALLRRGVGAAI